VLLRSGQQGRIWVRGEQVSGAGPAPDHHHRRRQRHGRGSGLYWESFFKRSIPVLDLPAGFTAYPRELSRPPCHWLEPYLRNIVHWGTAERGGHFAAFEQPDIFVDELRSCFALMR